MIRQGNVGRSASTSFGIVGFSFGTSACASTTSVQVHHIQSSAALLLYTSATRSASMKQQPVSVHWRFVLEQDNALVILSFGDDVSGQSTSAMVLSLAVCGPILVVRCSSRGASRALKLSYL